MNYPKGRLIPADMFGSVVDHIAEYIVKENLDALDVIDDLVGVDWATVVDRIKTELRQETEHMRAQRVEWEDKPAKCSRCNEVFTNKDLASFANIMGWGHKVPIGLYGRYCNGCAAYIKDEYEQQYIRACVVCGASFIHHSSDLCETHRTRLYIKEQNIVKINVRRTEKLGLPSTLTLNEWIAIIRMYDYKCAYCGRNYEHMDHVIPVSKGGGTTADNVVPACQFCNMSKHDRDAKVFVSRNVNEQSSLTR